MFDLVILSDRLFYKKRKENRDFMLKWFEMGGEDFLCGYDIDIEIIQSLAFRDLETIGFFCKSFGPPRLLNS